MGPETKLERKLTKWVKEQGGICIKLESPSRNGISDRLVMLPCWGTLLIELKTDRGRLSAEQVRWINDATEAGGVPLVMKGERALEEFKKAYAAKVSNTNFGGLYIGNQLRVDQFQSYLCSR